ncbi:DUF397 domain-containing protein [Kitasatospora sp. NPDC088134]|uniref:DUF397 domain-containing protein n=1 Tax=Kitasatospora sp. NPDC088134 TaxID=3364071 RepID=UPI003826F47E
MKQKDTLEWRKSSYSGGNGGECIEIATTTAAMIAVRDSKDPYGPQLRFSNEAWAAFAVAAASGEFGEV